ncbi:putative M18 family aminopeptidase 1 [Candidatus Magnetomoraceae bacterium gMMP-15]
MKKYTKKEVEELKKRLILKSALVWDNLTEDEKKESFDLSEEYKAFLDESKTEREAAVTLEGCALDNGFKEVGKKSRKIYQIYRNKCVAMAFRGKKPVSQGIHIIASHIDSPRLDLKQNPVYEDVDLAFLKTHYYGGIRKYQWLARALAIHGKIITNNGKELNIIFGETEDEPVFAISDLLPHLAGKVQENKKISEAFEGEKLNILAGSIPLGDKKVKERFKLGLLKLLDEKYNGITEEDFTSAEIEVVPAGRARDIGFDRSMIGAYGQDDRICAFAALEALCQIKKRPEFTTMAIFFDKEEIGSEGNTGAQARFMEDFVWELLKADGLNTSENTLRKTLMKSRAISGDVNAALDPDFQEVFEKNNSAKLGYGVCVTKYSGHRGKSGASDANAEFVGWLRKVFNKNKVVWQTGETGKIDEGGGGTVAKFLASYGMDIIDCGPAILSMHSPFEIASKADVYMTYRAYKEFFSAKAK